MIVLSSADPFEHIDKLHDQAQVHKANSLTYDLIKILL